MCVLVSGHQHVIIKYTHLYRSLSLSHTHAQNCCTSRCESPGNSNKYFPLSHKHTGLRNTRRVPIFHFQCMIITKLHLMALRDHNTAFKKKQTPCRNVNVSIGQHLVLVVKDTFTAESQISILEPYWPTESKPFAQWVSETDSVINWDSH